MPQSITHQCIEAPSIFKEVGKNLTYIVFLLQIIFTIFTAVKAIKKMEIGKTLMIFTVVIQLYVHFFHELI